MSTTKEKAAGNGKPDTHLETMQRYIAEIDVFAGMLRDDQKEIVALTAIAVDAKTAYEIAKENVREAKDKEHNTVTLLLKFIRPGSMEIMPLFDRMEPADEKVHGEHSSEWRKEPISALGLSALATRVLLDADIVLVGQLQDVVFKDLGWAVNFHISEGVAAGIEAKLSEFIEERTGKK